MAREYKLGVGRRAFNLATETTLRLGLPGFGAYILTTVGRKSGKERSTPVMTVRLRGTRYLIAPYGEVSWVHNARVAGTVKLSRGRRSEEFGIVEVDAREAAPVLMKYVKKAPVVLPYFDASLRSPVEAFEREADRHPVFRLTPIFPPQGSSLSGD